MENFFYKKGAYYLASVILRCKCHIAVCVVFPAKASIFSLTSCFVLDWEDDSLQESFWPQGNVISDVFVMSFSDDKCSVFM